MHKLLKPFIHMWISLASILAFGFGWVIFAHAEKPAPFIAQQPTAILAEVPTLEPIPSIKELVSNSSQPRQVFRSSTFNTPRLRARGS
jgi:hypothetical protein